MILIDYNGVAIGNFLAMKMQTDEDLLRHMVLNSIRMYRKKYSKEFGEIVVVADGTNNWRKRVFPQYKANRKKSREKSSVDWNEVFRILISADKDFAQLQINSNVKQYSPMTKKLIVEKNPRTFLLEHVLKGDSSDGVPNVLSDDDVFVDGRRQTPLSAKKKAALMEDPLALGEDVLRNIQRNRTMIDLMELPETIKLDIINNYDSQDPTENKSKVLNYLINKRCRLLIESVGEFIL